MTLDLINGWRTFMITIPSNADKLKETCDHLKSLGIGAFGFQGLDAAVSGVDHTRWTYDVDHPGADYHISPKHVNMVLSYLMLWKTLSFVHGDAFIILEDDVRFEPDWKEHFDVGLTHLPDDWDLLFLGSCCADGREDKQLLWGRLYKIKYALCTHAFAVRAKALPLLIKKCEKIWTTIDIAIALECMPHLNCYAFLPRLAYQHNTALPI